MEEQNYTEYNGKRILVSVMYSTEAEAAMKAIDLLAETVAKEPEQSVLVLLDVRDGKIFDKATARWKHHLPTLDKHVKRGAVVGPAWMRTITSVVLLAARLMKLGIASRAKAFATLEDARDYLVKD